jgi:dGTPase
VAYVNHDIDDAIRAGLIHTKDLPPECLRVLGTGHAQRITTMVNAIIEASSEVVDGQRLVKERIAMEDEVMEATDCLKNWMFDHVYKLEAVDETRRVRNVIGALFELFMEQPAMMSSADGKSVLSNTKEAAGNTARRVGAPCLRLHRRYDRSFRVADLCGTFHAFELAGRLGNYQL